MERKGQPAPEPEQILWREPFRCHRRRFPVIRGLWRGSRRIWALVWVWFLATFALGFAFAEVEVVFFPALFSHPVLDVLGLISMLWVAFILLFFIQIGTIWVVLYLTPAKVLILGGDLVLEKPRMRLPISEIKEARVTGAPTGPRVLKITTAGAHRSVGVPSDADLSELKRILGARIVFDCIGYSGPANCRGANNHGKGNSDDRQADG